MKNILVTGSKGQLGLSIKDKAELFPAFHFIYTDIEELDITNYHALKTFFKLNKTEVLINCAGYTAVDKAETEREKALLINAQAVNNLAVLSSEFGFMMIHLSTDYIFNGQKTTPYIESDSANPISVYGMSKYEGEKEMIQHARNGIILRTSWLYSEYGNNFVKTILRLSSEKEELRVVSDQIGTPTYAGDLAEIILKLINFKSDYSGLSIYNYSNEGEVSWFDFASAIVDLSGKSCRVIPIKTEEYPLPAKRPSYSVLSKEKIKKEFDFIIPGWKESLSKCLSGLKTGEGF